MKLIESISQMKDYRSSLTQNHQSIGFVATMGALHQGHLAFRFCSYPLRKKPNIIKI